MPIDLDRVVGASLPGNVTQWQEDDVILYHLGVGAGSDPTDPNELDYTYEARLKVLPSFGVLPGFSLLPSIVNVDGLDFNPMLLLHGEQDLVVHQPLPVRGKVSNTGTIVDVFDRGSGAAVVVETTTTDETGGLLATNRVTCFLRGEGGFGGERGPRPGHEPPDRAPDLVAESVSLPQQGLLYRLCGDKNPVHADPDIAKMAGFERPILHGLSSLRDGLQGRRRPRPRRRRRPRRAVPGPLRRSALPGRDHRHLNVARGRHDPPHRHQPGTGDPRPHQRRHHHKELNACQGKCSSPGSG